MEYGSVQFMGASKAHLAKLDAVQKAAERIGNFKVESLRSRREAVAVAFTLMIVVRWCCQRSVEKAHPKDHYS